MSALKKSKTREVGGPLTPSALCVHIFIHLLNHKHCFYQFSALSPKGFCTPKGVKIAFFENSLKNLLDGYLNIICAKFQLYNPYRFRKFAFNKIIQIFRSKFSEFLDPQGVKVAIFVKIVKHPIRWLYKHHLCQISAF